MTRRRPSIDLAGSAALALAMALIPIMPASAQPAGTFSLPPGETPRPAAGPADPETPSTTPSPVASPAATPTPPRIVLPPPPRATPSPRATATATARPAPRPTATPAARAATTPALPAAPAPTAAAVPAPATPPTAEPSLPPETPALPTEPAAPIETASAQATPPWAPIAGGIGLVLGIALIVWLLRRGRARRIAEVEERWQAAPTPPAPAPATPSPAATSPSAAPAAPPPYTPLPRGDFALGLDPQRMTLAMINATFVYRLTVGNSGAEPLGPLRITCDMISAHASLAAAEQLMPDPSTAWLSHDFDAIPPGESITIDGELRLPRAEIRPIRSGDSAIFAPLARFTLQTLAGPAPALLGARVFVIGEEAEQPGGPVRPFRLNDGTRSYSRISQREVAIS